MKNNQIGENILLGLAKSGQLIIDNFGRIYHKNGKRAEHQTPQGYLQVRAMIKGIRYHTGAHRLVYRYFRGEIQPGFCVNHINGIKDDNRPENLEAVTYSENQRQSHEGGLSDQYGQKNPAAKLTDRQVAQIRLAYANGGYTMKKLGDRFGVSFKTVSKIVKGQRRIKQGGPILPEDHHKCVGERDPVTGRFIESQYPDGGAKCTD